MLNISHYQRNANQNHNEVHFTPVRMAAMKKPTNNKKKEPSYIPLLGMQTSTATVKNSVEIPLKIANRTAL